MTLDLHTAPPNLRLDLESSPPEVHPIAARVFEALEREAIRWSLLRGERRLASPPHDVDLLVAAADLERASDIFAQLGFARFPTWARGTHQFFVAYSDEEGERLQMDVVTELAYGPHYCVRTDAASDCLARTVLLGNLRVLCGDDAFWTLLLHCVLDRGDVPPHQEERLTTLATSARVDSPLARVVAVAASAKWSPETALKHVHAREWEQLLTMRRPLIRRWMRLHPVEVSARVARGVLQWRTEPFHRFLRLRGLTILLIGDARMVSAVADSLMETFLRPVHKVDAAKAPTLRLAKPSHLATIKRTARGEMVLIEAAPGQIPARGHFDLVIVLRDEPTGDADTTGSHFDDGRCVIIDTSEPDLTRRAVTAEIWRRYRALRRWDAK